jgi:hypothetical protein
MGWGRFLLLGDLGQQWDLSEHRQEIDGLKRRLSHVTRHVPAGATDDLRSLRKENSELKLYLAAVVRLLTAKGVISRDEVLATVDAIDDQDGTRDGRTSDHVI